MRFQRALVAITFIATFAACARRDPPASPAASSAPHTFHSDYFVFLSTDASDPLVVPVDLNWEWSDPKSVTYELKAWRGTRVDPWPMLYVKETRPSTATPPATWPMIETGTSALRLARDGSSITVERAGDLGRIVIAIPSFTEAATAREPYDGGSIETRAARTTVELDGSRREGWLIHEHIAATSTAHDEAAEARRFGHFHWVPVFSEKGAVLYLFRAMGDGSRRATRWRAADGKVTVEVTEKLDLRETTTVREATGGRAEVPVAWRIEVPEWGARFELRQTSAHTGYGDAKPHGRALYRQALAEGTDVENAPAHGMVELILAD